MIDLIADHATELAELCRTHHVRTLEVFGSAANGKFDPATSDLDFLVDFEPQPPGKHGSAYFDLWFGLEDLFARKVDLVEGDVITNPYFLRTVNKSRRVVYAATFGPDSTHNTSGPIQPSKPAQYPSSLHENSSSLSARS